MKTIAGFINAVARAFFLFLQPEEARSALRNTALQFVSLED
jgi:hypothetical protein